MKAAFQTVEHDFIRFSPTETDSRAALHFFNDPTGRCRPRSISKSASAAIRDLRLAYNKSDEETESFQHLQFMWNKNINVKFSS